MGAEIPEKMEACRIKEFNKPYEIETVPVPTDLGEYDILVKTAVASYCHTDSMVIKGDMKHLGSDVPCTASHEGAGTVAKKGSSVTKFELGDRVMVGLAFRPCGHCYDCTSADDLQQYCQNAQGFVGVTRDGNFAEYVIADSRTSAKIPDAVSYETAAPMACAGSTVWRGVVETQLVKGEWVAMVGSGGGLGHLGIQFAKGKGLNVIGIDARDEGLALSKEAGADVVIDARKGDKHVVEEVHKVTGGKGADSTIVLSDAKTATATGCAATKMHGTVVLIAQPEEVIVPYPEFIFRDIRLKGSLICSPKQATEMLDFVAEHKVKVKANSFNGLKEISKLVELVHSGKMAGKGVVIVDPKAVEDQKKAGIELA